MKLILNLNQYGYRAFLDSKVDVLVLALKDYQSGYLIDYSLNDLNKIIKDIHEHNKQIYLSINLICNESKITELETIMNKISQLEIDGFIVTDFGVLQLFKQAGLIDKVIFNPITTITNQYSASISNNLGIHHTCLANELNINDIIKISEFNKGNVEILAQGYYQIGNSKRPLITNFFNQFKIKNDSPYYYIKEESRDYAYPIREINNEILIYVDKQRCILPYFTQLKETNIKYLRIDTNFMSVNEVNLHIDIYSKAIKDINTIDDSLQIIEKETNSNLKCLDNISILKKEKENE